MEVLWNPWHGCHKYSEGCMHCYVYRRDEQYELDTSRIYKTKAFDLPIKKDKQGNYKYPSNTLFFTCFTSDFFLEEADEWRKETWKIIRERNDCSFFIVTKRIHRFYTSLPEDWKEGYKHVTICCTVENQKRAEERVPFFLSLPIQHKQLICEPILERIDLLPFLFPSLEEVTVGGESGRNARICDYQWVLEIRDACIQHHVSFHFKQTGARFVKDGKLYKIPRKYQIMQAKKAQIDVFFFYKN